jgi:uncharacterized protein with PIN domain/sulfur carrier protein ThiS
MPKVIVRFYAELNDHLPPCQRMRPQKGIVVDEATVRSLLEATGIPVSEVDLVLVNGKPVSATHTLADGDRVSVYPVFESFDISRVTKIRERPLRTTRFVLDTHLGKLGSFLRMLGFDTLYQNAFTDDELIRISNEEARVLLSRDRLLVSNARLTRAYAVMETNPRPQLVEVLRRFDLAGSVRPFSRCMRCNTVLRGIPKDTVIDRLPPKTVAFYNEFVRCTTCDRVYWRGSHYLRMAGFIDRVLDEVSMNMNEEGRG